MYSGCAVCQVNYTQHHLSQEQKQILLRRRRYEVSFAESEIVPPKHIPAAPSSSLTTPAQELATQQPRGLQDEHQASLFPPPHALSYLVLPRLLLLSVCTSASFSSCTRCRDGERL